MWVKGRGMEPEGFKRIDIAWRTETSITRKLGRGTFAVGFFLACLAVLEWRACAWKTCRRGGSNELGHHPGSANDLAAQIRKISKRCDLVWRKNGRQFYHRKADRHRSIQQNASR